MALYAPQNIFMSLSYVFLAAASEGDSSSIRTDGDSDWPEDTQGTSWRAGLQAVLSISLLGPVLQRKLWLCRSRSWSRCPSWQGGPFFKRLYRIVKC